MVFTVWNTVNSFIFIAQKEKKNRDFLCNLKHFYVMNPFRFSSHIQYSPFKCILPSLKIIWKKNCSSTLRKSKTKQVEGRWVIGSLIDRETPPRSGAERNGRPPLGPSQYIKTAASNRSTNIYWHISVIAVRVEARAL